jgi:tRNA threonylcarbamoyladenosine biosynthesis protein TsaE
VAQRFSAAIARLFIINGFSLCRLRTLSLYWSCFPAWMRPVELMTREITTNSAEETIAFGRTLTKLLAPPTLVLLRGDLGAGKTTLVKGIAAAFEAAEEEDVTSPTFTLVHEYRGPRANLYHIDLYRVDTQRELETLGLDDLRTENSILLIEWGEKFPRLVRERDVEISLENQSESGRKIRIAT